MIKPGSKCSRRVEVEYRAFQAYMIDHGCPPDTFGHDGVMHACAPDGATQEGALLYSRKVNHMQRIDGGSGTCGWRAKTRDNRGRRRRRMRQFNYHNHKTLSCPCPHYCGQAVFCHPFKRQDREVQRIAFRVLMRDRTSLISDFLSTSGGFLSWRKSFSNPNSTIVSAIQFRNDHKTTRRAFLFAADSITSSNIGKCELILLMKNSAPAPPREIPALKCIERFQICLRCFPGVGGVLERWQFIAQ